MTKITVDDIVKYITYIRINFENAYKTNNKTEYTILIKGWYNSLSKYPKEIVDTAVNKAVEHSEFAPRLATVIKEIEKMQEVYQKSDTELWAELTSVFYEIEECANRFTYDFIENNGKTQGENAKIRAQEIFNSLSEELKEYLQNTGALVKLALSDNPEYEKGRFMRIMPEIKQRTKYRQGTPNGLETLVRGLAANLSIECDGTKQIKGDSEK